jgi:RNA polymerase sigma factor (sigma-70 family)
VGGDARSLIRSLVAPPANFIENMFREHNHDLVGYLRVNCQIATDAEDVAQNTWVRVLNKMDGYDYSRPFKPYLFGTADHAMYSFYRSLKRGKNKDRMWKSDFLEYNRPEYWTYISPFKKQSDSDRLTRYRVATTLRKMTWMQRRRFRKHYWRGYTYKEICAEEGLVSIAAQMHGARKKFANLYVWIR